MFALCPIDSYDTGVTSVFTISETTDVGVLIILAIPVAIIYVLWRIFVPPSDLPAANILALDPENTGENFSTFCWSGTPVWKPIVYFVLAVLTLIY